MDCPDIPDLEYSDYSLALQTKAAREHTPIKGSIELTLRCNLRCRHCYIGAERFSPQIRPELRTVEWYEILDQLADAGTLWLLITGGEPLLRQDFEDVYSYAKRKGFIVTLFTNGTRFSESSLQMLERQPPFVVEISLYGATKETYERVTGVPGSYDRCVKGIDLLLNRGIPVQLKTMAMTLNQHELEAMRSYAERLGVRFRYDALINAGFDGSKYPVTYRLSPAEVVQLDRDDPERYAAWQTMEVKKPDKEEQTMLYRCGAGVYSYHIDPYGRLSLCISSRTETYDLLRGDFQHGWHDFLHTVRQRSVSRDIACNTCELRPLCGYCPAWAQMEQGDPERPIEYLCEIAHLRASLIHEN